MPSAPQASQKLLSPPADIAQSWRTLTGSWWPEGAACLLQDSWGRHMRDSLMLVFVRQWKNSWVKYFPPQFINSIRNIINLNLNMFYLWIRTCASCPSFSWRSGISSPISINSCLSLPFTPNSCSHLRENIWDNQKHVCGFWGSDTQRPIHIVFITSRHLTRSAAGWGCHRRDVRWWPCAAPTATPLACWLVWSDTGPDRQYSPSATGSASATQNIQDVLHRHVSA